MRGLSRVIILTGLACIMLLGCDEDGSPTGSGGGGDASATIDGAFFISPYRIHTREIRMQLSSAEYDTSVAVEYFSNLTHIAPMGYLLTGVPPDTYTITPDMSECLEYLQNQYVVLPVSKTVSIGPGINKIDPYFVFSREDSTRCAEEGLCHIGGLIDYDSIYGDITGSPAGLMLRFISPDGSVMDSLTILDTWYRTKNDLSRGTYTIIPDHEYYTFDPPSKTIQADDIIAVANFKALYSGPERYTVSVSVPSGDEISYYDIVFSRLIDGHHTYGWYGKSSSLPVVAYGTITTPPVPPGEYELEISYLKHEFYQTIEITDHDIDLGDIEFEYTGELYYHVDGSVVDASGTGIPGVTVSLEGRPAEGPNTITWPKTTDDSGAYRFGDTDGYETEESMSLTLAPEKSGWVFTPPYATVIHDFDRSEKYIEFSVPDFVGTALNIAPFFPLTSGASWTYARSIDGTLHDQVEVVAGTPFNVGDQSYIPLSGSMMSDWMGFRVDGSKVYAWNGTDEVTYATLDETSWGMGKVDVYPATGTRLDSEDVTVPAGTFTGCEVIEISVAHGETTTETTTLWFAEDVGPVKVAFTTISRGVMIDRITDELTAYSLP
jgi:hypothetical protein